MNLVGTIQKRSALSQLIFFVLVNGLLILLAIYLPRFSLPLIASYVTGLVLAPILPVLDKVFRGNRIISIIFLMMVLGFFIIYPVVKLIPILQHEFDNFEVYIPSLEKFVLDKYNYVNNLLSKNIGFKIKQEHALGLVSFAKDSVSQALLNAPNFLATALEWIFLLPLFLFFILKDGRSFKYFLLRIVPNSIFERVYYIYSQFDKKISDYIWAKFIEAMIMGLIVTISLIFLNVKFAILLGLVAAVTNIVPYIGPLIGAIPGIVVVLADPSANDNKTILGVLFVYFFANFLDLAFIFPVLVSRIVNLHPVLVILSVIVGSQYMGILGMIISIPLATIVKLISQEVFREFYPESKILDE